MKAVTTAAVLALALALSASMFAAQPQVRPRGWRCAGPMQRHGQEARSACTSCTP